MQTSKEVGFKLCENCYTRWTLDSPNKICICGSKITKIIKINGSWGAANAPEQEK